MAGHDAPAVNETGKKRPGAVKPLNLSRIPAGRRED
jgi:hypothetical protein